MGKWTLQATEEVLLAKIRTAVQDAIETHRNEKRQEGEARPVSFAEFVEELDAKDAFTARLMEILVKEFSERRAKTTPVERRLQIASRTSKALMAIPRDAAIYDNSRPGRWPRTRYPTSLRRHLMDEDDAFGIAIRGDDGAVLPTATRDQLFQNAMDELEDGEFGAHWNSNLNEVYAEENPTRWQRSETIRPILHDVDMMGGWHVTTERDDLGVGGVRSTSPSSLGSEMESLAQSQEALSRLRARVGSLSDSLGHRLGSPRLPLVRRHSLRRSRFGRSSGTLDLDAGLRRRLERAEGEDGDSILERLSENILTRPSLRPSNRRTSDLTDELSLLRSETTSSGSALRRLWADYPVGGSSGVASGSNTTLPGRRSLRRGGLRPPETLATADHLPVPDLYRTASNTNLLSMNVALGGNPDHSEGLPVLPGLHPWASDLRGHRADTPTRWDLPTGEHTRTAPGSPAPADLLNIRVRWTEDLVNFPVTSEAAEHESVSAYPEHTLPSTVALPTTVDPSAPATSSQPGPSMQ